MNTKRIALTVIASLTTILASAQIPTEVPKPQDNKPVDFSNPTDIIIFIVLPLVVIVLFIVWRGKKRKDSATPED